MGKGEVRARASNSARRRGGGDADGGVRCSPPLCSLLSRRSLHAPPLTSHLRLSLHPASPTTRAAKQ
jgi:hypothetical protein